MGYKCNARIGCFIAIHPGLKLAPIRFVQFVPRFVPWCRLYPFMISMVVTACYAQFWARSCFYHPWMFQNDILIFDVWFTQSIQVVHYILGLGNGRKNKWNMWKYNENLMNYWKYACSIGCFKAMGNRTQYLHMKLWMTGTMLDLILRQISMLDDWVCSILNILVN